MAQTRKPTSKSTAGSFSAEERAAMKERAAELKAEKKGAAAEADVLDKIAALSDQDQVIAQRLHDLVKEHVPELIPKSWYGMPSYARDGKVVVFFQGASKFNTRYATVGFNDNAQLDDGEIWPTAYAITAMTPQVEDQLIELLNRATG